MCPHFEVVGHHEVLGDPFAEDAEDELLEISESVEIELLLLCLDQSHQTLEHYFPGQVLDVVLKWVGKKTIAHPDPGFAHQLLIIVANHSIEQAIEVLVVREKHVTADVVGEAVTTFLRRSESVRPRGWASTFRARSLASCSMVSAREVPSDSLDAPR